MDLHGSTATPTSLLLQASSKYDITKETALVCALHNRPLSFADNKPDMPAFANALLNAVQGVPASDEILLVRLFPSAKTVRIAATQMANDLRATFKNESLQNLLERGGGNLCGFRNSICPRKTVL